MLLGRIIMSRAYGGVLREYVKDVEHHPTADEYQYGLVPLLGVMTEGGLVERPPGFGGAFAQDLAAEPTISFYCGGGIAHALQPLEHHKVFLLQGRGGRLHVGMPQFYRAVLGPEQSGETASGYEFFSSHVANINTKFTNLAGKILNSNELGFLGRV